MRKDYNTPEYKNYSNIFDLEVSEKYRGKKLSEMLINKCIEESKKEKCDGVTLRAIDHNVEKMYNRKFGFKVYNDKKEEGFGNSPAMQLTF